jgi:hypothetical protein
VRTDRIRVALRRRSGLEAIDLGFALVRDNLRPLLASWVGIALPLAALVIIALRDHPFWALVALWWLRPAFARVPLHVLGRALFYQPTGWLDTLRELPGLARVGLGTSLWLQRFSPARSMLQPVLQLEGLRGRARRERCRVLARRDLASASALLSVAAHANAALILGLLLLVQLLLPEPLAWDLSELFFPFAGDSAEDPGLLLLPSLYLAGVSCVEPLVTAGGFALYLNRRVDLEGWDIDLAFRRLAERAERRDASRRSRLAGLAAACLVLLASAPLRAQPCQPAEPETAKPCIRSVLADPDFGSSEMRSRWVLRDFGEEDEAPSEPWLPAWLAEGLATVFELALWSGLVVLVVATLVAIARRIDAPADEAPPLPLPSSRRFGLDLDPRSLPDDLLAAARAAFARGDFAGALSLLYRGALVRLVERDGLAIPESATELECLALVRRARPERSRVFDRLTRLWLAARYAQEPPSAEGFDALCRDFAPVFGEAAP